MRWFIDFLKSSIGAKMLMAATGLALFLFTVAHMLGNLQVFLGPDAINAYGASLRKTPALLWALRVGLILAALLHIAAAVRLVVLNRAARRDRYVRRNYVWTGYAARTMAWSGVIILAFVLFHLAHFTFLWVRPELTNHLDHYGRHDVYRMVVTSFRDPIVVGTYIVAVALLCMHLSHGIQSTFQSLGLRHPKYTPVIERLGPALAVLLFAGYAIVPVAAIAGWLKLPGGA
jgi:succinate dehydrogenase / fumarate reductase cytochrome b subunit